MSVLGVETHKGLCTENFLSLSLPAWRESGGAPYFDSEVSLMSKFSFSDSSEGKLSLKTLGKSVFLPGWERR